ncbi:MAG: hypothetical protein ACI9JM_002624 [Halioglobus sp.]|jgi:uncharacterized protein (DUF934 family)
MPKLIKDGSIIDDQWITVDAQSSVQGQICTLAQWLQLSDKGGSAVLLEADEPPAPLFESLEEIAVIAINFPVFTDGRGFSYGRELRERGYQGELRASGHFIRDQMTYLERVGFNAFALEDESQLEGALSSLGSFTEFYQAAVDQPLPLFRRRE